MGIYDELKEREVARRGVHVYLLCRVRNEDRR